MKRILLALALLLGALAVPTPAEASSHAYSYLGPFEIVTANGLCADVGNWSTSDGGWIVQWGCHGGSNQRFWLIRHSGLPAGWYYIKNVHSGRCVEPHWGITYPGTKLEQWGCYYDSQPYSNQYQQLWNLRAHPHGHGYALQNGKDQSQFADVPSNSREYGVQLQIWSWNGSSAQRFHFR